jgi:hypothetical protein
MQILWGSHDSGAPASKNPLRTDSEQQVAQLVILPFRHSVRSSHVKPSGTILPASMAKARTNSPRESQHNYDDAATIYNGHLKFGEIRYHFLILRGHC